MDWNFDEEVENEVEDFLSLQITAEPEPLLGKRSQIGSLNLYREKLLALSLIHI